MQYTAKMTTSQEFLNKKLTISHFEIIIIETTDKEGDRNGKS